MSNEGKKTYYQNVIPHQDTIQAHFQGTQVPHYKFVAKTIVEGIIGEIYFHPEDKEQVKEGVLSIFQKQCPVLEIYHSKSFTIGVAASDRSKAPIVLQGTVSCGG